MLNLKPILKECRTGESLLAKKECDRPCNKTGINIGLALWRWKEQGFEMM